MTEGFGGALLRGVPIAKASWSFHVLGILGRSLDSTCFHTGRLGPSTGLLWPLFLGPEDRAFTVLLTVSRLQAQTAFSPSWSTKNSHHYWVDE